MAFIEKLSSQPDLCIFCFTNNGTLNLFATYLTDLGKKEIYSKTLSDCFGLAVHLKPNSQSLCEECVRRLREALAFKKQVQRALELLTLNADNREDISNEEKQNDSWKNCDEDVKLVEEPPISDDVEFEPYVEEITASNHSSETTKNLKQISERKRIKISCDTILQNTTACPFRHHKSWFRCFFCIQTFMDIPSLKEHTKATHTNIGELLKELKRYPKSLQIDITDLSCQKCNLNLKNLDDLSAHFRNIHEKLIYKECIADYKLSINPYTCHLCEKHFHVFRTLTTHLNEHYANFICSVCGKSFLNSKRLKVHNRTHESGLFPCTDCGKVLKTRSSYANHMECHSKRVLRCQICYKTMKHYNDRIKHMSEAHNITHKFACPVCAREYNVKQYLATHMRQAHGRRERICAECGRSYVSQHALRRHALRHKK